MERLELSRLSAPGFESGVSTIPPHPLVLHFKVEGHLLIVFNELNQERFELWNKPKHTLHLIFFHPEGLKF